MNYTILLFLGLVVLLIISLRLQLVLARRAVCKVIGIFRTKGAIKPTAARTREELGLRPRGLLSFGLLRDYKPWAFQTLVQAGVIRVVLEDMFYLSEDTLAAAKGIQCPGP